jgi:hypothetical protein
MGGNHSVGCDYGQPEPPGRGEYRMAISSGPELGVQVLRSTQPEYLLKETNISGEHDQPITIGREKP